MRMSLYVWKGFGSLPPPMGPYSRHPVPPVPPEVRKVLSKGELLLQERSFPTCPAPRPPAHLSPRRSLPAPPAHLPTFRVPGCHVPPAPLLVAPPGLCLSHSPLGKGGQSCPPLAPKWTRGVRKKVSGGVPAALPARGGEEQEGAAAPSPQEGWIFSRRRQAPAPVGPGQLAETTTPAVRV